MEELLDAAPRHDIDMALVGRLDGWADPRRACRQRFRIWTARGYVPVPVKSCPRSRPGKLIRRVGRAYP